MNPFAGQNLESGSSNLERPESSAGAVFETRRADLKFDVRNYADRLYASIKKIYAKYGVSSVAEMHAKIASGRKPKNLNPGELKSDVKELLSLVTKLQYLLDKNDFPPNEEYEQKLENAKEEIFARERKRLKELFGQDFDLPPLPDFITYGHIDKWQRNNMYLAYMPRVKMKRFADYPGWKHKPGKSREGGIEFFDKLEEIRDLPENVANHNLDGLEPDELPGAWMLVDGSPKPFHESASYNGSFMVEKVLKRLLDAGELGKQDVKKNHRDHLDPEVFSNQKLWDAFRNELYLVGMPATIRLPRIIESNVLDQDSNERHYGVCEWNEEFFRAGGRFYSGGEFRGGVDVVGYSDEPSWGIGFRPVVVFEPSED